MGKNVLPHEAEAWQHLHLKGTGDVLAAGVVRGHGHGRYADGQLRSARRREDNGGRAPAERAIPVLNCQRRVTDHRTASAGGDHGEITWTEDSQRRDR